MLNFHRKFYIFLRRVPPFGQALPSIKTWWFRTNFSKANFFIERHFNLTFFCFSVLFFLSFWFALLVLSSAFVFVFVLPLPFLFIFWLELLKCNIKSHDVIKLTYCLIGGFLCFFWIGGSLIIMVSQFSFSWMSFSSMFFLKFNNNPLEIFQERLPFHALFHLICRFFQNIIIYFDKRTDIILSTHFGIICCQQIILFDL